MFEAATFYEQTGSTAVAAKFVAEFKRAAHDYSNFRLSARPDSEGREPFH